MNKFSEFFKNNFGFVVGVIIGILAIVFKITDFIINLIIVLAFGFLCEYIQKNKTKVKDTLKNLIDKF